MKDPLLNNAALIFTVDEAFDAIGFGKFQFVLLLLTGIGFGSFTVLTYVASVLTGIWKAQFKVEQGTVGLIGTCLVAGEIVGGLMWGWLSDKQGRRVAFLGTGLATALVCVISCIITNSFYALLALRFLLGLSLGGAMAINTVFFVEFMPAHKRGSRTAFIMLMGTIGLGYMGLCGLWFQSTMSQEWPKFMAWCAAPAVLMAILRFGWLWESPRFLVTHGRLLEAQHVLQTMAKWNGKNLPSGTLAPVPVSPKERKQSIFIQAFSTPTVRIQTCLVSAIMFCHVFAYYGLMHWIKDLATLAASSETVRQSFSPAKSACINALVQIPGILLTILTIERVGRRWLLTGALLGCALDFLLTPIAVRIFSGNAVVPMVCIAAVQFFIVSVWTCLYVYVPEIFPTSNRVSAFAVCSIAGKVGGLISTWLIGWMLSVIKDQMIKTWMVMGLLVGLYFIASGCSICLAMETKGTKLADRLSELDKK